jgi:hypothetical protein
MYVCMYICMYVCVYVCVYVCMYVRIFLCYAALCMYRTCNGSVLNLRSPTKKCQKIYVVSELILNRNKPEGIMHESWRRIKLNIYETVN